MTTSHVVGLYRSILKYGLTLKYTDKAFFKRFIQEEFEKGKYITDKTQITQLIKVILLMLFKVIL